MGEVGFEPTQQLRHQIYSLARLSHVGAPPGGLDDSRGGLRADRPAGFYLELGVLGSAEQHPGSSLNGVRGHAPASAVSDQYKQHVVAGGVETLDHSVP